VVALLAGGGSSSSAVQGSGVAATQSRVLARFSSLDLAGSSNVTVVAGERQSVVVHADSNLIRHVTTRVVAGTLVVGTTGSFTIKTPMSVEVSAPSVASVKLSGSGNISVNKIEASRLTLTLSGSGVLYARGTATQLDVTIGGSGMAQLNDLVARHVRAVVTGMGTVTALGRGVAQQWTAMSAGRDGIRRIERFATDGFDVQLGGVIADRNHRGHRDPGTPRRPSGQPAGDVGGSRPSGDAAATSHSAAPQPGHRGPGAASARPARTTRPGCSRTSRRRGLNLNSEGNLT